MHDVVPTSRFQYAGSAGGDGYSPDLEADFDGEDLACEFATTEDELYDGVPFVGKLFRMADEGRRFVQSFTPEEPGTLDSLTRRHRGRKPLPAGQYLLRTPAGAAGRDAEITFWLDGPDDEAQAAPALSAPPTTRGSLTVEQQEAIEERIRAEAKLEASRKYRRDLEDAERELANAKHDRDSYERKAREASDQYDQLRARLREAEASAAEARAEAAEGRARLVREHSEELTRLERRQFSEVEKLRRTIADLKQEKALLELRSRLGDGGERDWFDKATDLVTKFNLPDNFLQMLLGQLGGGDGDDFEDMVPHHAMVPHQLGAPMHAAPPQHYAPAPLAPHHPDLPPLPADGPAPPPSAPHAPTQGDEWPGPQAGDAPAEEDVADADTDSAAVALLSTPETVRPMLAAVLDHTMAALQRTVDLPPDQFAVWLDQQRAVALEQGLDLGGLAGPLLCGLASEAASAAIQPERVAEYLAPTIDRLAPAAGKFLNGPSKFLAQMACQMAEVNLPPAHLRYLSDVLDALKAQRRA